MLELEHSQSVTFSRVYFLWGYVKMKVVIPPLPLCLLELKQRIKIPMDIVDVNYPFESGQNLTIE